MIQLTYGFPLMGIMSLVVASLLVFLIRRIRVQNRLFQETAEEVLRVIYCYFNRYLLLAGTFSFLVFVLLFFLVAVNAAFAFLGGALSAILAPILGVNAANFAAVRIAQFDEESASEDSLATAVTGSGVLGFSIAGVGLIGTGFTFIIYLAGIIDTVAFGSFAAGSGLMAFLMRVSGGVYLKSILAYGVLTRDYRPNSAGSEIPESMILQAGKSIVGILGKGSDLFESYVGSIIAVVAITVIGTSRVLNIRPENQIDYLTLPFLLAAVGITASLAGVFTVRFLRNLSSIVALRTSFILSSILSLTGAALAVNALGLEFGILAAVFMGTLSATAIGLMTEWYVSGDPASRALEASTYGTPFGSLTGMTLALQSTVGPILMICGTILVAFNYAGLYGIGIAAVSMLGTVSMITAVSSFWSIIENASGIFRMNQIRAKANHIRDELSPVGKASSIFTSNLASASTALTALVIYSVFIKIAGPAPVDFGHPMVMVGFLLGGAFPLLISQMFLSSIIDLALKWVGILLPHSYSSHQAGIQPGHSNSRILAQTVANYAVFKTILPAVLVTTGPLLTGLILGVEALAGLIAGVTLTGVLLEFVLSNSGGSLGALRKILASEIPEKKRHGSKMLVTGDDLFGDTLRSAGPAANILVKLIAFESLILGPFL